MNKIVLILIAIVLVGIAGFALLWFGMGAKLQERAEAILVEWRDGRVGEIYRDASGEFRKGRSAEDFKAYLDYWKTRRGAYEAVEKRTNVSTSTKNGGTRSVTLVLTFARGPAVGRFVFTEKGDRLDLVHMSIHEQPKAVDKADNGVLDAMAHSLFMLYSEKNYVGLYAALSSQLQQVWRPTDLRTQLDAMHAKAGRVDENFTRRGVKEEDKGDRRVVIYDIQFERTPGTARFSFQWDDDHWRVDEFRLKVGND